MIPSARDRRGEVFSHQGVTMSTEAQRNAANGSGNMFTMSADLSEITPVAPIARNGYAPFAKSTPDTLVSTDPIVSPVLSYSQKWAELYAGASVPATYWTPYDPLFIPANSFGPNSPAKRLLINGYYNLRGNTSSAGTWDSVSIGLYLDQAKTWSNSAQKIAGTSLNLPIPAGLSTRYGAFTAELSYLIHEGQTNFTQSLMYSSRIGSMNDWDPNLEVIDSYLENGNPIDWTVDHYLYTSWRVQNGSQALVIGSRYIEARL